MLFRSDDARLARADRVARGPCLFGLYSVVAALFALLPEEKRTGGVEWRGKADVSFSNALCAVRR